MDHQEDGRLRFKESEMILLVEYIIKTERIAICSGGVMQPGLTVGKTYARTFYFHTYRIFNIIRI